MFLSSYKSTWERAQGILSSCELSAACAQVVFVPARVKMLALNVNILTLPSPLVVTLTLMICDREGS